MTPTSGDLVAIERELVACAEAINVAAAQGELLTQDHWLLVKLLRAQRVHALAQIGVLIR